MADTLRAAGGELVHGNRHEENGAEPDDQSSPEGTQFWKSPAQATIEPVQNADGSGERNHEPQEVQRHIHMG